MRLRAGAKQRRREPEAAPEREREVRRLAISDDMRDRRDRHRRLLDQQLCRRRQAPSAQVLVEAQRAELRISALHLAWRARHGDRDLGERQPPPVVARDDDARQQVKAPPRRECVRLHIACSDRPCPRGTRRARSSRETRVGASREIRSGIATRRARDRLAI